MNDVKTVAARQEQLLDLLACPSCHATLNAGDVRTAHGLVWDARFDCRDHGLVGVVVDTKPSFLERDLGRADERRRGFKRDVLAQAERRGTWERRAEGLMSSGAPTDALTLQVACDHVSVGFITHDWSGIVEIVVDGTVTEERDLYSRERDDTTVELRFADLASRVVEVRPTGRRNGASCGEQVIVAALDAWVAEDELPSPSFEPVDRGNPYPPKFVDMLSAAPSGIVALDCGGGDRQIGDRRLFNLEYLPYAAPDLYADGLHLPFRDGAFDLILSQAVLEHVTDPQRAVDEMGRVLSHGGTIYVEIAFTQPLHAVPSHYFNVTPFGAEHLFREWPSVNVDWFGGARDTVEWWGRLVDLEHKWPAEKLAALSTLLAEFDDTLSYDELRYFASAVAVTAAKT
jgi:uncharacterized protein YbaR (Trm112 family)